MKILNASLLILLLFTSCKPSIKPNLIGKITDNDNVQQIKLIGLENGYTILDSTSVVNQTFSFNLSFKNKQLLKLRTNDRKVSTPLFFYEPGLNYTFHIENKEALIQAPENSLQYKYNELLKKLNPLNEKLSKISQDTTLTKAELNTLSTKYFTEQLNIKKNYIRTHPESYISLYLLKDLVRLGPILSYQELKDFFNIVNIDAHKGNPMLDFIGDKLKTIEANRIIGKTAPAFSLKSPNGKVYTLADFKGGYTLIDFWASWCAPCRVANKNIIPLYEKYKDKGFNIISISFDENKEKWVKAIEEDKIPWVQVSDLKGFKNSEIRSLYKVKQLPTTYVLDPEGKVVDQHLKHHELENLLETIYQN
ncbi:TlpA disulfide reductase family protein [Hyunsoonleella ulvae]|uniref:TlpA disulfide reductase family protein n=1 Tax=Hyunsoonleella ulvae TaxID=2799948 RepID=UPI00193A1836|nr:TlpA disulfide reductase family protein [Hyunsoonleella ulvae]